MSFNFEIMTGLDLYSSKVIMLLDNPFVSDARVEKEAIALINNGANVSVWCEIDDSLHNEEIRNQISIKRRINPILSSPLKKGYRESLDQLVKDIALEDFDFLHCHDFHMLAIGVEVKKRKNNVHLIYDAHEFLKGWPYYQTINSWTKRFKGWIVWNYLNYKEKKNIKKADAVLTVTNGIAERLKSHNRLLVLPTVLGNYPSKINLSIDKSYFKNKYELGIDSKVIVHSGTIYHTDDQLHELFDLIISIPNTVLVFIGNRPRFFEVKSKVEASPDLAQKIFFHDYFLNQTDNINLIASADVGLMHIRDRWLAHKITFANRFVEYIMAGIPVVATPQEFTEHFNEIYNCCTFYSENDKSQLKKSLIDMLDNLENFSSKAYEARNELDWNKESIKLITLYSSLLIK